MSNKTIYNDLGTLFAHFEAHKGIPTYTDQCLANMAVMKESERTSKLETKLEALKVTK